ncbi:hypothetical protein HF1_13290 [Mycoplasma haemofelis str. Langford 1]|uniref:Uncharacterized protein n=2 Tax=Mycoplasma haemofelis TaxID=29501 RepID=F6FGK3_MYCHI|nr:hypothetical protein [Mycoplasma haemofelis]AEG73641.1 hypothetical protein MHF_1407 [Mycoplasma haemofelis Ohio2]CBY93337.1 hypothetical protein HF1_13290 [Mycoplasma haemofelis str. Langford 1]
MTPLTSKTLAGLGSLAAVGGGSALAWQQGAFSSSPKNIRERLVADKYEILDQDSNKWSEIFSVYKGANNTKWRFENDELTSSPQDTEVQKLKNKCEEALKKAPSDEKSYSLASKWCVVPRRVDSFIDSTSLLNDQENGETDKPSWKKVLDKFKLTKVTESSSTKYAMSGVSLEEDSDGSKDTNNINKIKEGCRTRKGKYHYSLDFEDSLKEVKQWCTIDASK